MIVQSHTPEQVVQEALSDLPAMWNKMKEPLGRLQRKLRKDKSLRMVPRLFPYRSHAGNNWFVVVLPTKKVLNIVPFVWYRGVDGFYRAARIMEDGVCYHISHHVLDQYNVRFNRTVDGYTRMKEFMRENMNFGTEYREDNGEVRVGVTHGYMIGAWVVPNRIVQLITYVDHGRLGEDQLLQMDRLDEQRASALRPVRPAGRKPPPWDLPRPAA